MLHVLHERLGTKEKFVADEAARGVRSANQCCVLLQDAQMKLQFLRKKSPSEPLDFGEKFSRACGNSSRVTKHTQNGSANQLFFATFRHFFPSPKSL